MSGTGIKHSGEMLENVLLGQELVNKHSVKMLENAFKCYYLLCQELELSVAIKTAVT